MESTPFPPHDRNTFVANGVDINTIRAWLGHVTINTTNIYAEVDLEMQARALAHCEVIESAARTPGKRRRNEKIVTTDFQMHLPTDESKILND